MGNIKAVLFDLDGTLLDNYDVYFCAWSYVLNQYGVRLTKKEFYAHGGISHQNMLKMFLKDKYDELQKENKINCATKQLLEKCCCILPGKSNIMPYARETLFALKANGIKIAIVSATPKKIVEQGIDLLDVRNIIDFYISNEDVIDHKPHPECYLLAKNKYRLKAKECIVIEDSPAGINAGKRAKMNVIAVKGMCDEEKIKSAKPNYIFNNLKEIGEMIIRLNE
ncbi:MAG: HAD family phosphatase [Candidatus Aenigmarchaeota archaeon]|nr:HAD family phosphatase [Candidatus Aenigmarchaeota archaeon]